MPPQKNAKTAAKLLISLKTTFRNWLEVSNSGAQIGEDLALNGSPFFITQSGEASMVIESVGQFQEKEALIAAMKIMALGEKDRLQGKGFSVAESRAQLAAARQRRKQGPSPSSFFPMRHMPLPGSKLPLSTAISPKSRGDQGDYHRTCQ